MSTEDVGLLQGLKVVDMTSGIAGPYCTKLLADAGADVVKVEGAAGDPLRTWVASGTDPGGVDGALFQYLNTSKRSVVGTLADDEVQGLLSSADVLVADRDVSLAELETLRDRFPSLNVVSITPFGRVGPWADRPWSEFTLQADAGSTAFRGLADREPLYAGGRIGEWFSGVYAAVVALAAVRSTRRSGRGQLVDLSVLECTGVAMSFAGNGALQKSLGIAFTIGRTTELPSVEPTADGYVGFCTVTRQQFDDFLVLIEQPELLGDEELASVLFRNQRREEFLKLVWEWTTKRTTAEILEQASLLRIPVSPIGSPDTLLSIDQFVERGVFVENPRGGFRQPRPPYRVQGVESRPFTPSPLLGEHTGAVSWPTPTSAPDTGVDDGLPLAGLRVVDLTAFWAGPMATQILAGLGAEVIKVESPNRPDGMRFASARPPSEDSWWEWSPMFQQFNINKRGIAVDLATDEGRELLLGLVERSDVLIENFSPRVMDNFKVTWDDVAARNPSTVMVRMPAFGLSGPWRDRTGFAQTIEQAVGMAWITGYEDGPPVIPRGACDAIAGVHAVFTLLATLDNRDRTGQGRLVECPMVEAALNVAAEVVIESSAYGQGLTRHGNRGPGAVPQGVYRCTGDDQWLALSVDSDAAWEALVAVLGDPAWAKAEALATVAGRRDLQDDIDAVLVDWAAGQDVDAAVERLVGSGIAAAKVTPPEALLSNPQLRARGCMEIYHHPLAGDLEVFGFPFQFSGHDGGWVRTPPPMLGEHNLEVLSGVLGLSSDDVAGLRERRIIGDRETLWQMLAPPAPEPSAAEV